MMLSVSLVLLVGALLAVLLKTGTAKPGSVFVAALFGFLLATTGAAEPINHAITGTTATVATWHP
ncbi:hypothetical protein [Streptomyces sp. CA-111067]|uniref:hypothetical protein n=1 Tax=Streptomyces sp. CA-111067 TaxID=3240046 RepID=UPI003D966D23